MCQGMEVRENKILFELNESQKKMHAQVVGLSVLHFRMITLTAYSNQSGERYVG